MPEYLETTVDKFVFHVATDRLYGADGVWVQAQDGRVRVGVTDYVQQRNGDVAFAHIKPIGTTLTAGDELAEIETVKANVSLFCPIGGTVVEVNGNLERSPEIINDSPYDKGWLAVIKATDWEGERATLLDADAYLATIQSQAQQELNG
ncbi:MAG: glycine cleavage system protein H [Thermoguttaceae bacterium]